MACIGSINMLLFGLEQFNMRSSRATSSLSSVSTRSYDRSRHRGHSSRHSVDSDSSSSKSNSKMKFIIIIGIALPIIAAVIGVVAWAVSADSAFHGPAVKNLRRSDVGTGSQEEDIFQIMENRHEYSRMSPPERQREDLSRVDRVRNAHPQQSSFDDTPEKDPLYIVHFVPSPKPKVESSTLGPDHASTVSNEVLKKILSASKGAKPGTPQFVVFAPVPGEEDSTESINDMNLGASGLNYLSKPSPHKTEIDYDYEDELRKYQELLNSRDDLKEGTRVDETLQHGKSHSNLLKESIHLMSQNFTAYQNVQPRTESSNGGLSIGEYNQQPDQLQNYPQPVVTQDSPPQLNYQNTQQVFPNVQQSYQVPQQVYQPSHQPVANFAQTHQPVANYAQPHQQVANYQQAQQPGATDRSGHYEPLGIKFSIGNGEHKGGLLGGGYSPLGIISSILKPVLVRPKVNLNGKLMFGVMLEKGVKFGDNKGHTYG